MWKDLPTLEEIRGRLAKEIYKKLKYEDNSFIVAITGPTGSGKSQYAMKIAYQFYRDWDLVLSNIIFTPFELEERFNELKRKNEKIPILIWDDAGPWMRIMKNAPWDPLTVSVLGHLETMRLRVGAILMTMTSERSLPRTIKYNGNLYKFRARVLRNGSNQAGKPQALVEIQARREKRNEWGSYYWDTSILYRDYIILKIPNYNDYEVLRKLYIKLYSKLVKASREIAPNKLLDYIYEEWKKMKTSLPRRAFYEKE